ncbi:MAG: TIM barrel protein [Phycisphaerae bacterium]|nr:TIM barrel protein [Phycisphaerae bacterium]
MSRCGYPPLQRGEFNATLIRIMKYTTLLPIALLTIAQALSAAKPTTAPDPKKASPFFALCMDTHDAKKRNLAQQAEMLKKLGYDGAGHLWLKNIPERLKTLDAAGLKLFHIYMRVNIKSGNKRPYDPKLESVVKLLKGRKTSLVLLVGGMKPSDPKGDPRAVELVNQIADLAAKSSLDVILYPHTGDWLQNVGDAVRIAKKVDRKNVGVMFNLCHWLKAERGKNMRATLKSAMPYLKGVSIHGADTAAEIKAGKGKWIQPLGSGSFDVYELLQSLVYLGYKGPVGLQCYGLRGDASVHLKRSMSAWRKLSQRLDK